MSPQPPTVRGPRGSSSYTPPHPFTARRITIQTNQPVSTLLASLNSELKADSFVLGDFENRAQAALATLNRTQFESVVNSRLGESDFMIFSIRPMDRWYSMYAGSTPVPRMVTYTIGNPLIAKTLIAHDWVAPLNVPFNIIVVGDESSSKLVYDLPSSLIANGSFNKGNLKEERLLAEAARSLDAKVDALVRKVVRAGEQRSRL